MSKSTNANKSNSVERLDKIFSNLGICTRSECKTAAQRGMIEINGVVCKRNDTKINLTTDIITYKGQIINTTKYVYYMLYKPAGYITANEDKSQPVVFDLIRDTRKDLSAVGRLDKDTTGLLLITNDGELNHYLLSPKHHVPKRYEALIDGKLTPEAIHMLETGIDIGDDKPTLPATVEILDSENPQHVALTITEGRFHQVKRMFESVNCPVLQLHRSNFGPLALDSTLSPGEYRELLQEEITAIKNARS